MVRAQRVQRALRRDAGSRTESRGAVTTRAQRHRLKNCQQESQRLIRYQPIVIIIPLKKKRLNR